MSKAKKKNALKVVKPKSNAPSKPKGKELKTKTLGTLFYGNDIEKNIILKTDNLNNAITGIYKTYLPELAQAISKYLKANKKVKLDMLEIRKYIYKLVAYKTVSKSGEITKNQSFENNVTRAIQISLLIENKKSGVMFNKDNALIAKSKNVYPELNTFSPTGKKLKATKNTSSELVSLPIARMSELFKSDVLGQKTNNSKKQSTPKNNKSKTITTDTVVSLMIKHLQNLNSLPKDKLFDAIKGQKQKDLLQVAKGILRLVAKKSVLEVSEGGKVINKASEVLFSATFEAQNKWSSKHLDTAIKSYALEPVRQTG